MSKFINKILTTVSIIAFSSAVNASLITNGSFEQLAFADNSRSFGLIRNTDLLAFANKRKGWEVFTTLPGWITSYGTGIELQKRVVTRSQDGQHHVELDSHPRGASNSVMTQTLDSLTIGADYLLQFYYKPRTNKKRDNGINVYWHDASIDFNLEMETVYKINSNSRKTPNWALQSVSFTADANTMNLSFGSFGRQNTLGGLLDNVSLNKIMRAQTQVRNQALSAEVPEPASIILFMLALGLIINRQSKQAKLYT